MIELTRRGSGQSLVVFFKFEGNFKLNTADHPQNFHRYGVRLNEVCGDILCLHRDHLRGLRLLGLLARFCPQTFTSEAPPYSKHNFSLSFLLFRSGNHQSHASGIAQRRGKRNTGVGSRASQWKSNVRCSPRSFHGWSRVGRSLC